MADSGIPARRSAAYLLDRIQQDGKLLPELIGAGALDRLEPADRARAQRLAGDVLRHLDRADGLLNKHLQKAPPLPILNLLRLGVVELSQGAAAHGVINDLVTLAGQNKRHGKLKGLVNAVLRKCAEPAAENWNKLPQPKLPKWLRKPMMAAWGNAAVMAFERAHAARPPLDLTPKTDPEALAAQVGGQVLPTGSVRLEAPGQVSALPGYEAGDWWVQDAAAAVPARLAQGDTVLDLCAAPGGKTLQLAAAGHKVTAVDKSDTRMTTVQANLARTGLVADTIVADAFDVSGSWDCVLLDAPCSATGTIRRHPDLPYAKDGSEFFGLIEQQSRLIDHALSLLPVGGQLIYCTCSLLPDEGEVQIEEALARHDGLQIDTAAMELPWIDAGWRSPEGGLRLRPDFWADQGAMDGFYICALRKGATA